MKNYEIEPSNPEKSPETSPEANEVLVWGSNLKGQLGVGSQLEGLNFSKVSK